MNSLAGKLLVAIPSLQDSNFYRSVVLVLQHDEQGASGVILNQPTSVTIADLWSKISDQPCPRGDECIYCGGPVKGPLMALHNRLGLAESEIVTGVFLSMGRDYIDQLIGQSSTPLRLYSGYAGWGPGQLDAEVAVGGWLMTPADSETIFEPPPELWKACCQRIGNEIVLPAFDNLRRPQSPECN